MESNTWFKAMSIYDYRSFIHRFSFLRSYEASQEELQNRIPKDDNNYSKEEERIIHNWAIWSAEYGLAMGYNEEDIISEVAPLMRSINAVGNPDDFIRDIQNLNKRTPLLTAPIFIPYLHLAVVRHLKTVCGFNDHCQRIFYSLVIYKSLEKHDTRKDLWFEYKPKQLTRFGNFGKDLDAVRKYLKVLGNRKICSYRKRNLMGIGYRPKTFYYARINDDEIKEDFKGTESLTREVLLGPTRKMNFLPDYFKLVNKAVSDHFKYQPIPGGYIPHPDNPFLYLGEGGIKVHPEMANYDCVFGTLDLLNNFESAYHRRRCRRMGQYKILHYSEFIKYIPLGEN